MDQSVVESALDSLRPALMADNFALRLGALDPDGGVEVILEARPGACLDCLVPHETLVRIIEAAIRDKGGSLGLVTLLREGFDD
jgi:Fe-S cluster biogenesis protein NfuA